MITGECSIFSPTQFILATQSDKIVSEGLLEVSSICDHAWPVSEPNHASLPSLTIVLGMEQTLTTLSHRESVWLRKPVYFKRFAKFENLIEPIFSFKWFIVP